MYIATERSLTSNVSNYRTVFGGVTLLLFLICLCCQRKLQARTLGMAEITDVESRRESQGATRYQRRSDTHQLLTAIITPPPAYATVIKKESISDPAPPTYETAMAGLSSNGFV